jgi:hypothetical protein
MSDHGSPTIFVFFIVMIALIHAQYELPTYLDIYGKDSKQNWF